ncbi:MAG TPA: cupin domain-containing protein [Rhizomicrobium sp.]|nr:cupin domain-containing protein [Rhizomicrobium sp.]
MDTRLTHLSNIPDVAKGPWQTIRAERFRGQHEKQLGRAVGLNQFGVNHITLEPGALSSLRHWHEQEDEFVYVLSGELTLIDESGEHPLREGSVIGWKAGVSNAHHIANNSAAPASFISVGTRHRGFEIIHYPDDPELGTVHAYCGPDGERAKPPEDRD